LLPPMWRSMAAGHGTSRYTTVSKEQVKLARERCEGLPVTIQLKDYRRMTGTFDRIVSVGMFEHVGAGHYRTFMRMVRRCLAPEGLFLLHTTGMKA
jgi:cyclopropane-fatty-acyl-phospholipid synthase